MTASDLLAMTASDLLAGQQVHTHLTSGCFTSQHCACTALHTISQSALQQACICTRNTQPPICSRQVCGDAGPQLLPTSCTHSYNTPRGRTHADQTLDYSTQVFSLGVLLSSMLIYNQMGAIDESSVDKLSCVCEFAKRIKSKAGSAGEAPRLCAQVVKGWRGREGVGMRGSRGAPKMAAAPAQTPWTQHAPLRP